MLALNAAVIAAGAQGKVHVYGYEQIDGVTVVGIADADQATAQAASEGARDRPAVYSSYEALLDAEPVDILSICTPPAFHHDIVVAAIAHGVKAIHCEKPMALSFADAQSMHRLAADSGVLLTINHQRRFETLYRDSREAVVSGELGSILGLEGYCANLFDWGSHLVDLLLFLVGDSRPDVVFGQIEVATKRYLYGALAETASVTQVHWSDGLNATVLTGRDLGKLSPIGDPVFVVDGSEGRLTIANGRGVLRRFDGTLREIESRVDPRYQRSMSGVDFTIIEATALALADLVRCLRDGGTPVLDSGHGLAAAEIIFATYESSARRGPVRLPLTIGENALVHGIEEGYWEPVGESRGTY